MTLQKVSPVIARRSRSNLTALQDNGGEIATLPSVARNDRVGGTFMPIGAPEAYGVLR